MAFRLPFIIRYSRLWKMRNLSFRIFILSICLRTWAFVKPKSKKPLSEKSFNSRKVTSCGNSVILFFLITYSNIFSLPFFFMPIIKTSIITSKEAKYNIKTTKTKKKRTGFNLSFLFFFYFILLLFALFHFL